MPKQQSICKNCGRPFLHNPSRQRKFCSSQCYHAYAVGEHAPRYAGGKIRRICKTCGAEFFVFSGRLQNEKSPGIYCSRKCYHASLVGKTPPNRKSLPVTEIASAYLSGQTSTRLAEIYNTSVPTILSRLREAGVQIRPPTGANLRDPAAVERSRRNHPHGKDHYLFIDLPMDSIRREYLAGKSTLQLGAEYDVAPITISKKLKKMGVRLRPPGFCDPCECSDGHIADSQLEKAVDEWLTEHALVHEIHPPCPWPHSRSTSDFLVNDTYIEVWGIDGNAKYDERRRRKIVKYRKHGANLIQIFPHHIHDEDFLPLESLLKPQFVGDDLP